MMHTDLPHSSMTMELFVHFDGHPSTNDHGVHPSLSAVSTDTHLPINKQYNRNTFVTKTVNASHILVSYVNNFVHSIIYEYEYMCVYILGYIVHSGGSKLSGWGHWDGSHCS